MRAEYLAALPSSCPSGAQRARSGQAWPGPWLVLILDRAGDLADFPAWRAAGDPVRTIGITAICLDGAVEQIAEGMRHRHWSRKARQGTRIRLSPRQATRGAVADQVDGGLCEAVARSLAPLVDAATDR